MIERYTRPQMGAIWTDENKFRKWLDVEIAVCEAQAELNYIPKEAVDEIKSRADFNIERVLEIEQEVKHDVIAFLTNVAEYVGESSRYIHLGMTSSDLLDTANALLMREAGEMIRDDLRRLQTAIKKQALEHKHTPCIGRSHGVHAEPITFGLKMAMWYDEVNRQINRLDHAIDTISVGQVSGAVGTFAHIDPQVEAIVCQKLRLKPAPVSTQIIQRDRYAEYMTALALIGSTLEKFALEIRNLQRTEIKEVEEYFSKGQKGSSAMPHKRNPISCEQICGLARVVRANAIAAMENVALWHERDITHSSVERVILPDSTILIDYMTNRMAHIVENLLVYPENMMRNIEMSRGLIFSQAVLMQLVRKNLTREKAYKLVQDCARKVWEGDYDFKTVLLADSNIRNYLGEDEITACFDLSVQLRQVDTIFRKAGL